MSMRDEQITVPDSLFAGRKDEYRKIPYIYSPEEVEALVATARKRRKRQIKPPHNHAALLGLLAATGLRVGEALRLDDEDIDWDDGLLHVRNSKNLPWRMVPLHPSALNALREHVDARNHEHPHRRDQALYRATNGRTPDISCLHCVAAAGFGFIKESQDIIGIQVGNREPGR